jgi:hypothetical protein
MRFSKRAGTAAVLAAAATLTTAVPAGAIDGTLVPQGLATEAGTAEVVTPQATLFTGTFRFKVDLQGRDMTTGTSRFCNEWRIDAPERRSTTFFQIQLWRNINNGSDVRIENSQAWNPQNARSGRFCANVPDTRGVYYYRYVKTNDTGLLTGSVTVSD